jgi:hypothetical protein
VGLAFGASGLFSSCGSLHSQVVVRNLEHHYVHLYVAAAGDLLAVVDHLSVFALCTHVRKGDPKVSLFMAGRMLPKQFLLLIGSF